MKTIRNVCVALLLAAGCAGVSHAAPVPGTGGGYYGSAWYDSRQGTVIAGAATWAEYNQALHDSIHHAVTVFGWHVVQYNPCKYHPPFGQMLAPEDGATGIEINARTPGESGDITRMISDEIRRVRELHRADDYDASIKVIYEAAGR